MAVEVQLGRRVDFPITRDQLPKSLQHQVREDETLVEVRVTGGRATPVPDRIRRAIGGDEKITYTAYLPTDRGPKRTLFHVSRSHTLVWNPEDAMPQPGIRSIGAIITPEASPILRFIEVKT